MAADGPIASTGFTREEIATIARRHHDLMRAWVLMAVMIAPGCLLGPGMAFAMPNLPWLVYASVVAVAALHVYAFVAVLRLTRAVGGNWVLSVMVALWCALPVLNIILMLVCALESITYLRAAAGRVPFLGFTPAQFAAQLNCCRGCGYSLPGLRGEPCPQCGTQLEGARLAAQSRGQAVPPSPKSLPR